LPDEETTEEIKENLYFQYFLGYEEFSHKAPFDPSLFVTLRERIGVKPFEKMTRAFINRMLKKSDTAFNMLAERSRGELLIRRFAPFDSAQGAD
jgi:hypothetical protein